ncbi:MAG: hypothetical protein KIT10_12110 [Flavobacteriales bacterium]|nr:hypothetical protein [Flavobacteriales bacterium]
MMRLLRTLEILPALMAVALVLALSACGKEPLVEPCTYADDAAVAKAGGEGQGATSSGASTDEGNGEGTDISDDGDDLGDSERNRKKRPN